MALATADTSIPVTLRAHSDEARLHRAAVTFRTDKGINTTILVAMQLHDPNAFVLRRQAEDAGIEGSFEIRPHPDAEGGHCVVSIGEPHSGRLSVSFNVPEDGTYYLLARVLTPGPQPKLHDSFFAALNDAGPVRWDLNTSRADAWQWIPVQLSRTGAQGNVTLEAGANRLTLLPRERLSHIDALLITDQPGGIPDL